MLHAAARPKHHRWLHQIPLVAKIHQPELITRKSYERCPCTSHPRISRSSNGASLMMMDMMDMPGMWIGMVVGMGIIWLFVIAFLALGIAAFIKYLRS